MARELTSDGTTTPRSPAALRLARELAAVRRTMQVHTVLLGVLVLLEIAIALMIRLR